MLIILHGDNIEASRNELVRLKGEAKDKEIRDIAGKNLDPTALIQALESTSLFGSAILVVIENLLSPFGRKTTLIKPIAETLTKNSKDTDIILWEPKELGKSVLMLFPHASVKAFCFSPIIFRLLDEIRPENTKKLLQLYEKTVENDPPELILYMIQSRIRQLIEVKDQKVPQKTSPWQLARLTNQARLFSINRILAMHTELLELEFSIKTGASPYNLPQALTKFILDI